MLRINNCTGVIVDISTYNVFVDRRLCCVLCILRMWSRMRLVMYCVMEGYIAGVLLAGKEGGEISKSVSKMSFYVSVWRSFNWTPIFVSLYIYIYMVLLQGI
jgi:hypothetical protein